MAIKQYVWCPQCHISHMLEQVSKQRIFTDQFAINKVPKLCVSWRASCLQLLRKSCSWRNKPQTGVLIKLISTLHF